MSDERDNEWKSNFLRRGLIALLLLAALVSVCPSSGVMAQDQPSEAPAVDGGQAVSVDEAQPVDTADSSADGAEREADLRQQSAVAGLLVLALLCVVFLTLIVIVVLWARRMRLLTSKPLPDQHPGDPLWYLRKPVEKSNDGGSDE